MPTPQMYVLICLEVSVDKVFGSQYSIEPLGVFDDLDQAIIYATKLDDLDTADGQKQITYDVLEFQLNEKPHILTYLEQRSRKLEDNITSVLISLMKKGYVDQLVGEDGMFYYELTKKGEEIKEDMPKLVKKLFRKRKGRDDK
tara:strand:- start:250 stop:678 length:429 start_codon:yes stop_codon:yes gene_type:complete